MFSYAKGKRKLLFCTDSEGNQNLHILVQQALNENVPFEFHILQEESDEEIVNQWFVKQKMGTYLYISGTFDFVKRIQGVAMKAGFSQHDMQSQAIGPVSKKLVCCTCHGKNEVSNQSYIVCGHCGQELEMSDHYSSRLDAFLGYITIK
ncbi:dimethylamine monooxygenase subunit DmmA family protein [Mesobacillus subterraneus]|uniref:dimethylamine monooxygenase subunit DmmA family protein n=1 Tax=Mesobacillus subterraneus TaxID=285983 RepID=UPI001CFE9D83|nr:dimethylamine monooxygenase subunit DmmA family protein [Mesobacillus subterraneus]WLR55180.1 dimethylamine monooxygenase subunit DmmA family protein [Mesobacillus subterraneus]